MNLNTQTLQVFDPAKCCSTGVCGPEVDTKLVQFAADFDWLKSLGIIVRRHNLSQNPAAFVENEPVKAALTEKGVLSTRPTSKPKSRTSGSACEPGCGCHQEEIP